MDVSNEVRCLYYVFIFIYVKLEIWTSKQTADINYRVFIKTVNNEFGLRAIKMHQIKF